MVKSQFEHCSLCLDNVYCQHRVDAYPKLKEEKKKKRNQKQKTKPKKPSEGEVQQKFMIEILTFLVNR